MEFVSAFLFLFSFFTAIHELIVCLIYAILEIPVFYGLFALKSLIDLWFEHFFLISFDLVQNFNFLLLNFLDKFIKHRYLINFDYKKLDLS